MARPKSNPKTQKTSPMSRSRWPSMPPRKGTELRSGTWSVASPPAASLGCASALEQHSKTTVAIETMSLAGRKKLVVTAVSRPGVASQQYIGFLRGAAVRVLWPVLELSKRYFFSRGSCATRCNMTPEIIQQAGRRHIRNCWNREIGGDRRLTCALPGNALPLQDGSVEVWPRRVHLH